MLIRFFFYSILVLFLSQCNVQTVLRDTTPRSIETSNPSGEQLRQTLVNYAKEQQGVPYNYGGRTPRGGFDCSGFVYYVYNEFDINVTPVSRIQETEGRKISLDNVQTGDLVFFRKSRTGSVFHVALVVDNTADGIRVIHSTSSRGVIVENISRSSYWQPKLSSARTFLSR